MNIQYHVHNNPPVVPVLSQMNSFPPTVFLVLDLNLVLDIFILNFFFAIFLSQDKFPVYVSP